MVPIIKSRVHARTGNVIVLKENLEFDIPVSHLPLVGEADLSDFQASRLMFTLWGCKTKDSTLSRAFVLGWVNVQMFNHRNILISGSSTFNLWLDQQPKPSGTANLISLANS